MKLPTELDTVQVNRIVKYYSEKNKQTYYGIHHEGRVYFLGKSLKVGKSADGLPNIKIGDYVRIGYYDGDKGRTYVAYSIGAVWSDFVSEVSKVEA